MNKPMLRCDKTTFPFFQIIFAICLPTLPVWDKDNNGENNNNYRQYWRDVLQPRSEWAVAPGSYSEDVKRGWRAQRGTSV